MLRTTDEKLESFSFLELCLIEHYFPGIGPAADLPMDEVTARLEAIEDIRHMEKGTYNHPEVKVAREMRERMREWSGGNND